MLQKQPCGPRFSVGTHARACCPAAGVHDTLVNQLLTKIDGVDSLNNILLIGMTNRKDMLDEALLRPGRLEVQVEIGLPDENGRLQILKVCALPFVTLRLSVHLWSHGWSNIVSKKLCSSCLCCHAKDGHFVHGT